MAPAKQKGVLTGKTGPEDLGYQASLFDFAHPRQLLRS